MSHDYSVIALSNRTSLNSAGGAVPIIEACKVEHFVGPDRIKDIQTINPAQTVLRHQFHNGMNIAQFQVPDSLTFGHYLSATNCFFHPLLHEQGEIFKDYIDSLGEDPLGKLDQHFKDYEVFNDYCTHAMADVSAYAQSQEPHKKPLKWIHDYQFTMVGDKDIFTHHQAWPKTQFLLDQEVGGVPLIEIPHFQRLVSGMLDCKLMTMQRNQDIENFVEVARMIDPSIQVIDMPTGQPDAPGGKQVKVISDKGNRTTVIAQKFVGISLETVREKANKALTDQVHSAAIQDILGIFPGKNIFLSVHRDCTTKAIDVKLEAIDKFFTQYPERIQDTAFMFFLSPTRGDVPAYAEYQAKNLKRAEELNKKYGNVLHYTQEGIPHAAFMGLLRQPQITGLFNTATRDGHDLTGREATAANDLGRELALIVSSGIGAVDVLGGTQDKPGAFVLHNPRSAEETATLIEEIVELSKTPEGRADLAARFDRMKLISDALTAEAFGESVLNTYRDIENSRPATNILPFMEAVAPEPLVLKVG